MLQRTPAMRWLRRLDIAVKVLFGLLAINAAPAFAAGQAMAPASPHLDGFTNILGLPPGVVPDNGKSLFEAVPFDRYTIPDELGASDVVDKAATLVYGPLSLLGLLIVRTGISLTWWVQKITVDNPVGRAMGSLVENVSTNLNAWLLPSALAIGVFIAFARSRKGEDAFGQVVWTAAMGLLAIGLALSGGAIVNTLDGSRTLVSNAVSDGTATLTSGSTVDQPVAWPGTNFNQGSNVQQIMRRSGDTAWRVFAVTPYCETAFGSLDTCRKHAVGYWQQTTAEKRTAYKNNVICKAEGGGDSDTCKYVGGHSPIERILYALFGLLLSVAGSFVLVMLSAAALIAWFTALLLLGVGSFFACIMVIPGRARQMGTTWLATVVGSTIYSALVGGLLTATLVAMQASASAADSTAANWGFFPTAMLSLFVLGAAWKTKGVLEGIVTQGTPSGGGRGLFGALAGMTAARAIGRTGGRLFGRVTKTGGGLAGRGALAGAGAAGRGALAAGRSAGGGAASLARRAGTRLPTYTGGGGGTASRGADMSTARARFAHFTPKDTSATNTVRPTTAPGAPAGSSATRATNHAPKAAYNAAPPSSGRAAAVAGSAGTTALAAGRAPSRAAQAHAAREARRRPTARRAQASRPNASVPSPARADTRPGSPAAARENAGANRAPSRPRREAPRYAALRANPDARDRPTVRLSTRHGRPDTPAAPAPTRRTNPTPPQATPTRRRG